jgi:hypothetical protein
MEQTPDGEIRATEQSRRQHDDQQAMRARLSRQDTGIPVALEATVGWSGATDLSEEVGHPGQRGHPPMIACVQARTLPSRTALHQNKLIANQHGIQRH